MEYNDTKKINDRLKKNREAINERFKPVSIMTHIDAYIDEDWFIEALMKAAFRAQRKRWLGKKWGEREILLNKVAKHGTLS